MQVNTIPLIAIMTAVTTVLTMLVKIPTPIRGYLNLSDTMIYFSAYAFGPWVGGVIGGLGPALSDLISGYPQWAIFTFVIDGLQAVLVGLLVKKFNPANIIIGSVIAGVWKVFGYFIAGGILSGFGPALGEIAGNSFQMAVGLIVGFALFTAVRQAYPPLVRLGNLGIKAGSETLISCEGRPVDLPMKGDSTGFIVKCGCRLRKKCVKARGGRHDYGSRLRMEVRATDRRGQAGGKSQARQLRHPVLILRRHHRTDRSGQVHAMHGIGRHHSEPGRRHHEWRRGS